MSTTTPHHSESIKLSTLDRLIGVLQHVAVILNTDDDTELLRVGRALPERIRHPACDLIPALLIARRHGSGEQAQHRRAEFGRDFDPGLRARHIGRARVGVWRGEVVTDARAADVYAELKRTSLEPGDKGIVRHARIPGKVVPGGIDGVEVVPRAELEELEQ